MADLERDGQKAIARRERDNYQGESAGSTFGEVAVAIACCWGSPLRSTSASPGPQARFGSAWA